MTYTMSFFVRQMWVDPRLSFNSRRNIETIMLDASTSERLPLWIPDTYFVNELLAVEHEMLVRNQFCRISQDGTVLLSRRVTLTAFSPMNPNLFPYDSHKLRLHLESYGSQIKDMTYHWAPERVSTADYVNGPGFFVSDFLATNSSGTTSTGSYSRLTIEIDVKRNPLPHELGLLLPLCLLSILCLCTTWIQEPIYGSVVAVYLVSVIAILYGTFILNDDGNIPCMTPLHIYALLSCGLGFGCLLCKDNVKLFNTANKGIGKENTALKFLYHLHDVD
ncbi:unnamed protein product [Orchesella dallaii]|uniref:Neurotransmitter-gated ion-channel ligand-binding domain-containing protein n=1 Tax=Orchesella dallaii TaxID=48710 RepID=A0ABP1QG14_9HEXA